ncbi:hypothetical protein R1flu_004267 [Riccia fluitans]|uniref:ADP-ribosylation factor-like protein n=1 Tax=Riccia fluitans TaxID=41844 RepID=A0ABD1YQ32_9MARC
MGLLSIFRKFSTSKREETKILLLGLESAGKSSCLAFLCNEDLAKIVPTRGFIIKSLLHDSYRLNIWDVGGQRSLRPYWINCVTRADALIYVVDSADRDRHKEAANELSQLLAEQRFIGVPLLVFANKQDLLNALSAAELLEVLELSLVVDRSVFVQPCSGKFGDGTNDGMEWIMDQLKQRYD